MKKRFIYLAIALIATSIYLFSPHKKEVETPHLRDYAEIEESRVLRAITEYNAVSFFPEDGKIKGFNYELLRAFADSKGWELEVIPEMSLEKQIESVLNGSCDILANSRVVTSEPNDSLINTNPFLLTQLVLVQRKPTGDNDSLYIRSQLDLADKKVYVAKGSAATLRIENLSNEIGDTIYIEELEKYGTEQLLALVAGGDIDYAVCEKSIAQAWAADLPQLDMERAIGFTQRYAWSVNPQATVLLDTLNRWIEEYSQTKAFKKLRKKYYNY
ncbi:MAG: transporter substrate-binding domain-containing protein [Phocaeicola sp.]